MKLLIPVVLALITIFNILFTKRNFKGVVGVLLKIPQYIFLAAILFGYMYLFRETIAMNFQIDVNELRDVKAFVNTRLFATILTVLTWMFILVNTLTVVFTYIARKESKKEIVQYSEAETITFDIPVIPNIDVLSDEKNNFKEGLEATNLVFSFAFEG